MKTKCLLFASIIALTTATISCSVNSKNIIIKDKTYTSKLIFEDDFDKGLANWKVEQMPEGTTKVINSKLEIDDVSGCTVWLNKKLEGAIGIEYDVFIIQNGGANDRVSDLNCFWMANDPQYPTNLFAESEKRGGKFSNYDSLKLYYMGVGGNDNGTTRFRRYIGNGERPLLTEHDLKDAKYMLQPNKTYHIKIIASNNTIQYYKDDVLFVDFTDDNPYTSGYFGFRTVKNHMTVDNFKVYKIKTE